MFNKKHTDILICIFLILSNALFVTNEVKATADTTPPVIKSISVDKKMGTNGDNITVTIDASDDISGIKMIRAYYTAPTGSSSKAIYLNKNAEGKYTGVVTIGQNDEIGMWKISFVTLVDNASNSIDVCNTERSSNPGSGILQDLSSGGFEVSGTTPDTNPPVIKSISVDKKMGTNGDNITVTIDASDDISGIKMIRAYYTAPTGSASKAIYLNKNAEGKYTGVVTIGQNDEIGMWKISFVTLVDNASNSIDVCNTERSSNPGSGILQDLSSGGFEVSGTTPDTNPPVIKSISVDKKMGTNGDNITVTIDASDDISGIKMIRAYYTAPTGSASKAIYLNKNAEGKYTGVVTIGQNDEIGMWKISFVTLVDNASNSIYVCNTERSSNPGSGILQDLSSGGFEVKTFNASIMSLPQKFITQNETWTSNTINGDLYIGPNAVLTINGSVTVTGNIYVLGAIRNYGNLTVTGGIYANSFNFGSSTLYNGTVLMLGGTNSISSMVASNAPIDIPFKLYEANNDTLVAFDGKVSVTGATLPIVDLYVDNNKVNYYYNGTFNLDLDTNNKQRVGFKTIDVYGNEKTKSYTILNKYYDTNLDSSVDIADLATVAKSYNTSKADTIWQDQYDYNCDGVIDIYDLVKISKKIN